MTLSRDDSHMTTIMYTYVSFLSAGHVPTKHKGNRPLGRWVSTQRNMKKNYDRGITPKSLDHEEICRRINLLEGIGFAWSMVESPTSIGSS